MSRKYIIAQLIITALILVSCSGREINDSYIRSATWVYDEGYKVGEGDFVEFDDPDFYQLYNDTIFRKGIPVCRVISASEEKHELEIRSFSGLTGLYIDTKEFSK